MTSRLFTAAVVASLAALNAAHAQTGIVRSFDAERLELNVSGQGSLVVGSGDVLPNDTARFSLTAHYQYQPLVLYSNGARAGAPIIHRLTGHLTAAYSVAPWLELGLQVPVVAYQSGDSLPAQGIAPLPIAALGSTWAQARLALFRERDGALLDGALQLSVKVPGSSTLGYTRDAWTNFSPRLSVGSTLFHTLRVGGEIAYTLRPLAQLGPDTVDVRDEVGSELLFSMLVATARKGLNGEISAKVFVPLSRTVAGAEVMAAVRYPLGDVVELYAIAGPGIGRTPGIPFFRVLAGVSVTLGSPPPAATAPPSPLPPPPSEEKRDADQDGVLDADDGCPMDKGPPENKGCPANL